MNGKIDVKKEMNRKNEIGECEVEVIDVVKVLNINIVSVIKPLIEAIAGFPQYQALGC